MPTETTEYNGWANYETWNVALYIGNDEGLYNMAMNHASSPTPYKDFVEDLQEITEGPISYETPDGVAWNDSGLDVEALDEMIRELE